jgi:peptide/nickel transport system ATP-binding protein
MSVASESVDTSVLEVRDLRVDFAGDAGGVVHAVNGISFNLAKGETLGIVGESGSGKSMSALAVTRMLPPAARIAGGSVRLDGTALTGLPESQLRAVRGARVGMVFQDPMTSLNPVLTVGQHFAEAMRAHSGSSRSRRSRRARAAELLELVGIPDPVARLDDYPHQFSGGMRQRAMIALALANDPEVLIADEPTTSLDATVQAQILDLITRLNRELGTAVVLISHNLGVIARTCARVLVVYAGGVVEEGATADVLARPRHPYTTSLLRAIPRFDRPARTPLAAIPGRPPDLALLPAGCAFAERCQLAEDRCRAERPPLVDVAPGQRTACWVTPSLTAMPEPPAVSEVPAVTEPSATPEIIETSGTPVVLAAPESQAPQPLLEVTGLSKHFPVGRLLAGRGTLVALDDVSLTLRPGETLGIAGESGCGKSTLARTLLGIHPPTGGSILFRGADVTEAAGRRAPDLHRQIQMVFQDPYTSLNPRMTAGDIIAEPLRAHGLSDARERRERVADLLRRVGLDPAMAARYPQAFSGGQRQRIGIARALATDPSLLICDEPVSALDVSAQAQVINLLTSLQAQLGLAMLFIAHDLALVRHVSHRIAVMYLGRVVEVGPAQELVDDPLHPYTRALLSASPKGTPGLNAAAAGSGSAANGTGAAAQRERIVLTGDVPSPLHRPSGCPFHTRCPAGPRFITGRSVCAEQDPALIPHPGAEDRSVACHFPGDWRALTPATAAAAPD